MPSPYSTDTQERSRPEMLGQTEQESRDTEVEKKVVNLDEESAMERIIEEQQKDGSEEDQDDQEAGALEPVYDDDGFMVDVNAEAREAEDEADAEPVYDDDGFMVDEDDEDAQDRGAGLQRRCSTDTKNTIRVSQLDDDTRKKLEGADHRKSHISASDLMASMDDRDEHKSQSARLRKAVVGLIFLLIVLLGGFFAMSYMAIQLSKEMKMSNNGAIMAMDGSPARIASSELAVNEDGTLVAFQNSSNAQGGKAKKGGQASMPLATRPAEVKRSISSTIPNKLFDEMAKLTVNGADGVSHMTLQILAVTRVLTAHSKCGSLVHLRTIDGTVTLDDTVLHFDDQLSARALALNIDLDGASMHGRRLASGAEVAGMFNFFEDFDWQCDSIPVPKGIDKPYVVRTLKKTPCPAAAQCSSILGRDISYPGHQEETNSVIVAETIADTDDFFLSIQRYPNHPMQTLVEVIDHKLRTHRSLQIFDGSAYRCVTQKYASVAVGNATDTSLDKYFAAYLGHETPSSEEFDLPWGHVTIPQSNVRAFRLEPKEGIDAMTFPIHYYDDAETLLLKRIVFDGGEQMGLEYTETLVEGIQQNENAQEAALALRKKVDLHCAGFGSAKLDVPILESAVTENKNDVDFYVKQYLERDDQEPRDVGMGGNYWMQAIEMRDPEKSAGRRLLSKRVLQPSFAFSVELGDNAEISVSAANQCMTVGGETSNPASPWSFSGELAMGMRCKQPYNSPSAEGKVTITYGKSFDQKKEFKVNFGPFGKLHSRITLTTSASISGWIGASTQEYWYLVGHGIKCADRGHRVNRRLGSVDDSVADTDLADPVHVNATAVGKTDVEKSRDLLSSRLGSRRLGSSRRRRGCWAPGIQAFSGLSFALVGEIKFEYKKDSNWKQVLSAGLSLTGQVDLTLGPFSLPQNYLDARAKGVVSGKACAKAKIACVNVEHCFTAGFTLFDEAVPV